MSHAHHEGLPGYDERRILHDGCGECELRGKHVDIGIGSLDADRFAYAWRRATEWQRNGDDSICLAEAAVLRALWAVQVQMERRGIPIGDLPTFPAWLESGGAA